jgi:hypothetical protein
LKLFNNKKGESMRRWELESEKEEVKKRGREIFKAIIDRARYHKKMEDISNLLSCHRTRLYAIYRDESLPIPLVMRGLILRNHKELEIPLDLLKELIHLWPEESKVLDKIVLIRSNNIGLYVLMSLLNEAGKLQSKSNEFIKTKYSFEFTASVKDEWGNDFDVFLHVSDFSEIDQWNDYYPFCHFWEMDEAGHRKSVFVAPRRFREATKYCKDFYEQLFSTIWEWDRCLRDGYFQRELGRKISSLDLSMFGDKAEGYAEKIQNIEFAVSINPSYFHL